MAQVGHLLLPKETLGLLECKLVLQECVKDHLDVTEMLSSGRTVYEDVIEKHQDELPQEGLQHFIHEGLERSRGVRETERHHKKFKETLMSAECRLWTSSSNMRT